VIIIDSMTHEWDGEGGIKEQKDAIDARGGNQFTNWGKVTPLHNKFINTILKAPCHIISTLRCKHDVVVEQVESKGRMVQAPKKVGTKAIQREGVEFELDLIFDMAHNKTFSVTKDRTGLFDNRIEMLSESIGEELRKWLSTGKELTAREPAQEPAMTADVSGGLISFDQETELSDLVRDSRVDKARFFAAYQISNLSQMKASDYMKARTQLTKRLAEAQAQAQLDAQVKQAGLN